MNFILGFFMCSLSIAWFFVSLSKDKKLLKGLKGKIFIVKTVYSVVRGVLLMLF